MARAPFLTKLIVDDISRRTFTVAIVLALTVGCASLGNKRPHVLRVATTTSLRDSGLLDELLPIFEARHNCRVDTIAVGSGAALRLGEAGDVDVVLAHARDAELEFMDAKHGVRHEEFMMNYFVIAGQEPDHAGIRESDPALALPRIAEAGLAFISRGDNSGTHQRELSLWEAAGGRPAWDGYLESGQGMGATLLMADEKRAYTLVDTGTLHNFARRIDLVPLSDRGEALQNHYAAIVVNPNKNAKVNAELAQAFVDFLIAGETQRLIGDYHVMGKRLFEPTRISGFN